MKRAIKISIVFVMFLVIIFGWGIYHFTWDTQSIHKGELIRKVNSPKGKYTANIYNGKNPAKEPLRGFLAGFFNKKHCSLLYITFLIVFWNKNDFFTGFLSLIPFCSCCHNNVRRRVQSSFYRVLNNSDNKSNTDGLHCNIIWNSK